MKTDLSSPAAAGYISQYCKCIHPPSSAIRKCPLRCAALRLRTIRSTIPALRGGVLGREVPAAIDGHDEGALVKVVSRRAVERPQLAVAVVAFADVGHVATGVVLVGRLVAIGG